MMLYSRIITGIIFFTILFAQTDKGKEQSRSIPKKFEDGFVLEPVNNQTQFQNPFNSDEIAHISNQPWTNANNIDNEAIPLGEPVRRIFSNNSRETVDTLDWGIDGTVNFGFFPGDVMMEVYQAPADLILYGVGVDVFVWNTDGTTPSLKVEVWRPGADGYPYLSDGTTYPSSLVDGAGWIGYAHPTDNDTIHYPDTSYAVGLEWNDFANGGTCDNDPEPANGQPLMGTKVLPAGLVDYAITNPGDSSSGLYWVDFTNEGGTIFSTGEYIAVVITYLTAGAGDPSNNDTRIGLLAGDASAIYPYPATKFYNQGCGGTSGNHGWHIRHYNWRFAYAVELTCCPNIVFLGIDPLPSTLSTESRTVSAHIAQSDPFGGDAGIVSATISYQIDSLTADYNFVSMYLDSGTVEDGYWKGEIPGQSPGTTVYWVISAQDVNGLSSVSSAFSYFIFEPTPGNDLIFNNQYKLYGNILYSSYFYFYWGGTTFDIWDASYGGIVDELIGHYTTIIELGSDYNNDAEIAAWWGSDKTYIVSGDEWLGARSGWTDGPTADGSVAKNILGIAYEYNDINYAASGDESGVSRLMAGTDGAASTLAGFLSDSLYLNYDPDYETGRSNWLDGVDPVDGYTVDMTGYSLILDSASQVTAPTGSAEYNVMIHGQQGNGGLSAFLAFDAVALNTVPSYHWVGASYYWSTNGYAIPYDASPLIAVYELLKATVSVEDGVATPNAFLLKGNYPNPFNPITNIHYILPENTQVKITIYDVLGREVKSLLNAQQTAGEKTIQWNSRNDLGLPVAAGVYLYQIRAGEYVQIKKMLLLK